MVHGFSIALGAVGAADLGSCISLRSASATGGHLRQRGFDVERNCSATEDEGCFKLKRFAFLATVCRGAGQWASNPMKPSPFQYHVPLTVDDAVTILNNVAPDDGHILAGGQSLVPTMAYRMANPAHLVDINRVAGVDSVGVDNGHLSIGCLVRHAAFETPVIDGPIGDLLPKVCHHIAHYPIRRRGTFCGSLAHADPASEWCLVATTLNAIIELRSVRGTRMVAADDFFEGMMSTARAENEMLVSVRLPLMKETERFGFFEFSRRAGDFGLTMVLAVYELAGGSIVNPRIGLGGVEDRPSRNAAAEQILAGSAPSDAVFVAAAEAASASVEPMEDIHAPASYRRHLVKAGVLSALRQTVQ